MLYVLCGNLVLSVYNRSHFHVSTYSSISFDVRSVLHSVMWMFTFYLTILLTIDIYNPAFLWVSVCSGTLFGPKSSKKGHSLFDPFQR